jgi:hypothetical protein
LDCAKDYVFALQLRGLEKRKKLAELSEYGCVRTLPWLYHVTSKETQSIAVREETIAVVHRILGVIDSDIMGTMPEMTSDSIVIEGWVLDEHLVRMTGDEFREELRRKRENSR